MIVNTNDMRKFLSAHGDVSLDCLDKLVEDYKRTKDPTIFVSICQKTIGAVSKHAKDLNNPDFTEPDAYSHGLEVILEAIDKFNPNRNKHFLTMLYLYLHNKFDTLAYRSKQYRSYLISKHRKNKILYNETKDNSFSLHPETSLENLIDIKGESAYNDMPSIFIKQADCSIDSKMFSDRPLAQKIINFIVNNNVISRPEIANSLEIDIKKLNSEIRFIKKCLLKN